MNTIELPTYRRAKVQLAIALIVFLLAASLPYSWLIEHFGYDGILRRPGAEILTKFHAGGAPLILAWFGFALGSMLFIPVALCFDRPLSARWLPTRNAPMLGVASAVAQAIGLLRWVLVVPALASAFADPATSADAGQAVLIMFDAVHRYGGMVIGEMVGQLLLAGWTALTAMQLYRARAVPRWTAAAGALTLPLWLLGQSALLHMVVPAIPSVDVIPLAFMAWEAWLALLAGTLLFEAWREGRPR